MLKATGRFSFAIILLAVLSITKIICICANKHEPKLELSLFLAVLIALLGEILYERNLLKNKYVSIITAIPAGVISCAMLYTFDNEYMIMAVSGIIIAVLALVLYVLYKNAENKLIFSHLIKSEFICGLSTNILAAGVAVSIAAINALLFKMSDMFKVLEIVVILFLGFLNLTLLFGCIPKPNEKLTVPKIYRTIIHKALFYTYLFLISILYLYILKVIILQKMPVGKFNWFGCFALLFFIFFYLSVDEEDGQIQIFFKKYGSYLMIPILIMQIIGIYIRVSAYGLTLLRFLSMILILVAGTFLVCSAFKWPVKYAFAATAIITLIFTCTPLNVIDVPNRSQEKILKNELVELGIYDPVENKLKDVKVSKKELSKANSAYEYLDDSYGKKSKLFDLYKGSDYPTETQSYFRNTFSFVDNNYDKEMDISQYKTVKKIEGASTKIGKKDLEEFFLNLDEDEPFVLYKDENVTYYFTEIYYEFEGTEITTINWDAYLLEK